MDYGQGTAARCDGNIYYRHQSRLYLLEQEQTMRFLPGGIMKRYKKRRKERVAIVRPKPIFTPNNPAYMTWKEILAKYNNGNPETIFGTIIL
jgi:hypothetical protein